MESKQKYTNGKENSSEEFPELKGLKNIEKLSPDTKKWLAESIMNGEKDGITAFQIGGGGQLKKKEPLTWAHQIKAEEVLQELSKNPELTNKVIESYKETLKEMEEAIKYHIEYPSNKQKWELSLMEIKDKKGRFFNLIRKFERYKLKKSANKPPKKLDKDSRKFLEEKIKKYKNIITTWEEYKKKKLKP